MPRDVVSASASEQNVQQYDPPTYPFHRLLAHAISIQWVDLPPTGEEPIVDCGAIETDDIFGASDEESDDPMHPNLHPDDPAHFFKLSHFLKLVLATTVTDNMIDEADTLIREYCTELLHVRKHGY